MNAPEQPLIVPADPLPAGWDARLPGGITRRVRVRRAHIGLPVGAPWAVCTVGVGVEWYAELLIEGPCRCVHDAGEYLAQIETDSPILVRSPT